tara:strand:- start:199 stop:1107 length:909 start_codon:yes stop_codon:yes gene_type:complete
MLPLPSTLKLGIAFLCAVSCTSTASDSLFPISGTLTNDVIAESSIDYDAEWKAFVHEQILIHEQKPEHPFWSAANDAATSSSSPRPKIDVTTIKPIVANGSESAVSADTQIEMELQEILDNAYEPVVTEYEFYSRGPDIMELQQFLDVDMVDGIYGPQTRAAHIEFLGGPEAAVKLWYAPTWDEDIYVDGGLPTLNDLVNIFFFPEDRVWALRVAMCESSGQPTDAVSTAVHSSSGASGWFQHLPKFWETGNQEGRVWDAGFEGNSILDPVANVGTAAYLFYRDGDRHWNPSKSCWGGTPHG